VTHTRLLREDGQRSDLRSAPERSRPTQRYFTLIGMAPVQNLFDKTGERREERIRTGHDETLVVQRKRPS
jgi:hypothetical protein